MQNTFSFLGDQSGDDQVENPMAFRSRLESDMPQDPNSTPMAAAIAEEEPALLRHGRATRTKNLLLAALRVWELKQGIHDSL